MERLQFRVCFADKLYLGVTFRTRHEVVDVDKRLFAADTVHTSYALHQAGRVPRGVIVQDDIGPVQVHSLCQHLGRDDHIIVVLPFSFVIGVEVLFYRVLHFVAVGGGDDKCLVAFGLDGSRQRPDGVDGLGENDQFAGCVRLRVEQLGFYLLLERIKLGVLGVSCPAVIQV